MWPRPIGRILIGACLCVAAAVSTIDYGGNAYGGDTTIEELAAFGAFVEVTPTGTRAVLGATWRGGDAGLELLHNIRPALRVLDASDAGITDRGVQRLKQLSSLRELWLSGNTRVSDESMQVLGSLATLRELRLDSCKITDRGISELARLRHLICLSLNCPEVTDNGLEHLSELTDLKRLFLGGTEVTDEGLRHLRAMRQLEWLFLNKTKVTGTGFSSLKDLKCLKDLFLGGSDLDDEGLLHVCRLDSIQLLDISNTHVTDKGVIHLKNLSNLRTLSAVWVGISTEGAQEIRSEFPDLEMEFSARVPEAELAALKKRVRAELRLGESIFGFERLDPRRVGVKTISNGGGGRYLELELTTDGRWWVYSTSFWEN